MAKIKYCPFETSGNTTRMEFIQSAKPGTELYKCPKCGHVAEFWMK